MKRILLLMMGLIASTVSAQIVVTSSTDSVPGSLRHAISIAASGDTITFTNTLSGTSIILTNGQLRVDKSLTIDASMLPDAIAIDGNADSRIFEFASGTTNLVDGLTLTNGSTTNNGGGIYLHSGAELIINDCTISDNNATNGGGIYSAGLLNIQNSIISNNFTHTGSEGYAISLGEGGYSGPDGGDGGDGGGIYSAGSITIQNSAVIGNNTGAGGGANDRNGGDGGDGGGIYSTGLLTVQNSAITGNNAGAGGTANIDAYGIGGDGGDGGDGGGIYSAGSVTIEQNSDITGNNTGQGGDGTYDRNSGDGGDGGGIYSTGSVTIEQNSNITGNNTGVGGSVGSAPDGNSYVGSGGNGGGIYCASTSLVIRASTITENYAGRGGIGSWEVSGGIGGSGGGVYFSGGSLVIENSAIFTNRAGNGGEGDYSIGGEGGSGGGLYVSGSMSIDNASVSGNFAGHGSSGYKCRGGDGGSGGGIISVNGPISITNSTVSGNFAGNGGEGNQGRPAGNGGSGGGIYAADSITIETCTVSGNRTGDSGWNYSAGHGGNGGGIYAAGLLTIESSTVSANHTGIGGINGGNDGDGGGIYNLSNPINCTNTIVAGNEALPNPNIYGSISSDANNLTNGVPLLAPLGDYGGPTQTMPPLPGSPVIDAGGGTAFTNDQRGYSRVVNGAVDIGAVEFQGNADIALFWSSDWDGDGNPFGIEYALGTDWAVADPANSANLVIYESYGNYGVQCGFNPDAADMTAWVVMRSVDLKNDSFEVIYRYDGPTDTPTAYIPAFVNITDSSFVLLDFSTPQPTNAFYKIGVEISP